MPSSTFSLFPSASKSSTGPPTSSGVPPLATRRSTMEFKRTSIFRVSPIEEEPLINPTAPAQHRSSEETGRISRASGTSSATACTIKNETQSIASIAPPSLDRARSPDSYLSPSERSTSPTLVGSSRNSVMTLKPRKKGPPSNIAVDDSGPLRSIFPTYDPERALEEQYYLPTQVSPTNIPYEQVCKVPYSPDLFPPEPNETMTERGGLYFTAPQSSTSAHYTPDIELPALWELSNGRANAVAKSQTYRLQMHRNASTKAGSKSKSKKPVSLEPVLTFGPSTSAPFLSVFSEQCKEGEEPSETLQQRVRIRKHNLSRFDPRRDHYADSSVLVSDLTLESQKSSTSSPTDPELAANESSEDSDISAITPHKSILDSLSMAGSSSAAAELAAVDPGASSIEAANLAERAMVAAKETHTCILTFETIPGMRQRGYALRHRTLGLFRIQIEGDVRLHEDPASRPSKKGGDSSTDVKKPGIIKILAPISGKQLNEYSSLASPRSASRHPNTVLASIDLSTSTLLLNGAHITDLNDRYILDTAISALISVLMAETASPRVSHLMSFAPPPTKASLEAAMKGVPKYKYFPLIKTQKQKKPGRRERTAAEMEENLGIAFGAMVFVLSAAVDGLATWADRAKAANNPQA